MSASGMVLDKRGRAVEKAEPTEAPSAMAGGVIQSLLRFLDRNLGKFSARTRDAIGLTLVASIALVVLNGLAARTYVQGHLWVRSAEGQHKHFARRFVLSSGGGGSMMTNNDAYWVLPLDGVFPTKHDVTIMDTAGEYLAEFSFWGPLPILSALHVPSYDVIVNTFDSADVKGPRVTVSLANTIDPRTPLAALLAGPRVAWEDPKPGRGPDLRLMVHLAGLGDVACEAGEWCGTRGESRRLEGFAVWLPPDIANVELRYKCHVQGSGDTGWISQGQFCGTRGQSKRIEGIALRLDGPRAAGFHIAYQVYMHGAGNSHIVKDGGYAGTRGQGRQVEAIRVWLERGTS